MIYDTAPECVGEATDRVKMALTALENSINAGSPPEVLKRFVTETRVALASIDSLHDTALEALRDEFYDVNY